ncbi:MAG: hypothetical protein GEV28_22700 [Actinophytocola sp.]|uniref:hypothetical protein n=1 Tax=Actinophytocola sp. TaxID=1872138 RepID=UPI0013221604|nr:hypothetical protein [Actinophytocola sp.]MPZ83046.1 hypothetical protein [Actinophytocola sp.]
MGTQAPATSSARVWTIAGLLVGAVGLVLQKLGGITMPAVPPGLIFVLVAAAQMVTKLRWAGIVAILAGAAEIAGFFGSGSASYLTKFDELGATAGSWLRIVGVITAVVAGILAVKAAYSKQSRAVTA